VLKTDEIDKVDCFLCRKTDVFRYYRDTENNEIREALEAVWRNGCKEVSPALFAIVSKALRKDA
jgi:hypothetical protein